MNKHCLQFRKLVRKVKVKSKFWIVVCKRWLLYLSIFLDRKIKYKSFCNLEVQLEEQLRIVKNGIYWNGFKKIGKKLIQRIEIGFNFLILFLIWLGILYVIDRDYLLGWIM